MTFSDDLLDLMQPMLYAEAQTNQSLTRYLTGIGLQLFQQVEDWASDGPNGEPGYSILVDATRVPNEAVAWLSQFVGVRVIDGQSSSDQRAQLVGLANWRRGTVAALQAAPAPYLTGGQTVIIKERDTSPYHFQVQVLASEIAPADRAATNLITNGGFETNATGWTAENSAVLTRDLTDRQSGSASLKVVTPGSVQLEGAISPSVTTTAGQAYTGSLWIIGTAGRTYRLYLFGATTMAAIVVGTFTGSWQQISVTGTSAATGPTSLYLDSGTTAQAMTYWIDSVQIETGAIPTPYIETNGASASRAATNRVLNALISQKPAGLQFTYIEFAGQKGFAIGSSALRGTPADALRLAI